MVREWLSSSALLRTRERRLGTAGALAMAAIGALVLASHGGGASSSSQRDPRAAVATSPGGPAGTPASTQGPKGAAATASAAGGQRTATPRPASSAAADGWFTVTLGASCVVPGGTQTLAAQSRPGYTVAYNSRYADGRMGDAYGGDGVVATDAHGRVSVSWTVSASAPLGTVSVGAGTANGGPATTLTRSFTVAAHC